MQQKNFSSLLYENTFFIVTECKTYSNMYGNINAGKGNNFVVALLLSVYYYFHMKKTCWEKAKVIYNDILASTLSSDESELTI
jgi:hypothetical protein